MSPRAVPVLPFLVPLGAIAFALMVWRLRRRRALTVPRGLTALVVAAYGAAVLARVLPPIPVGPNDRAGVPLRVWLHLTPLVDAVADPIGIVLNVALFVPLGLLVPLVTGISSLRRTVLAGFLVSLAIETLQFLGDATVSPGRVADVDDLIGNTVGAFLGYALFRLLVLLPLLARAATEATWPEAGTAGSDVGQHAPSGR